VVLFWYFMVYSWYGFLLEIVFARIIRAKKRDRKCFLVLPLCPVYGLGALAILSLPQTVLRVPVLLVLFGGLAATGTEYMMALFYEKMLRVSFWDYSGQAGNWKGRVCPQFSLFWGLLAAVLVCWIHPWVSRMIILVPPAVTFSAAMLVVADGICTVTLLRRTRSTDSLRWYDGIQKPAAG